MFLGLKSMTELLHVDFSRAHSKSERKQSSLT